MTFLYPFLIAFFLIPFVQKFLQLKEALPAWHDRLRMGRIVAFVLLGAERIIDTNTISPPVFFLLLLLVAIPAYLLRQEAKARLLLWMIVPLGIVFLIDNLAEYWMPNFYERYDDYFDSATSIVFLAGLIIAFMARKQQKGFEKAFKEEQLKREKEEEYNRILEAKKLDLETQVAARTAELVQQKEELEKALEHLKATQEQLIQSEKLASLGELTAGIAHEIQNPLNFVNNFSELSVELIEELKAARQQSTEARDEALEEEILSDLAQNQQKINHHGKRAASIVTGMLQHSRANSGKKELTDLNKIADEYLRLSYHGIRARDKSFVSDYEFIADENLPLINVVPQDIGRVLLNLINNAFQAPPSAWADHPEGGVNYHKKVTVKTFKIEGDSSVPSGAGGGCLAVSVSDNGAGIASDILPKIFQPFFTTKPTGQGTGLGLSLAYDIVTKGHGGTLEVESVEGEGTTFTVKLPVNN